MLRQRALQVLTENGESVDFTDLIHLLNSNLNSKVGCEESVSPQPAQLPCNVLT